VAAVTEIRQADDDWWRNVAKDLSMKTRIMWTLGWLAPAVLVACATNHSKTPATSGKVTPQMRSGSTELRTYQVMDWIAPDDRTLIVNSVDRSLFRARFKGQCAGLRLVDTIAFIVQTPPQVDKYEGVVLPDGTRCAFASITRLETAPPHGKDGSATEHP
jgi:hypothetical protein